MLMYTPGWTLQVFHCVHFECPADTSLASLMQSVTGSGLGGSLTSGPPNSPHLVPRPSGQTSGPPMPVAEPDDLFFDPQGGLANSAAGGGGGSDGGGGGGGAAEGQALPHLHHHHHHRHSSVSSNASSSSNLMGVPSPRMMALDVYARPESQQDVPEADRMELA